MTETPIPADLDATLFDLRHERSRADLWPMLEELYGRHPDHAAFDAALRDAWRARPADLRRLDLRRDLELDWFQRPGMAGYVLYVDRFCGTLAALPGRLDHSQALGVTWLHLMPPLEPRPGANDGG